MPDWLHRFARPREGWLSLFLLFVMLLSVGWSVQSARWLEQADFLVPVAMWGLLAGTVLALAPLSVTITLPIGALAGAGIVLWSVGGEYFTELGQLGRLFALRETSFDWLRIVVDGGFAPQMTPYALGLGVIVWSVAFMAAYTLYRHHRVLDAILLVGAALIANVTATLANMIGYLVLFCLAALLLWLRAALITREESWQLRRVNENVEVPISIMRTGLVFIAGSIALAFVLTTVAVAAPLTNAWRSMDVIWDDVRDGLDGIFGSITNPEARIAGTDFGSGFTVSGSWVSDDAPVMTVAADDAYYMRTVTYDIYTGHGWTLGDGTNREVAAGDRVFAGYTPERPLTEDGFERVTIDVQLVGNVGRDIYVPGYPTIIYAPVILHETAGQPVLGAIDSANAIQPGQAYQVTSLISKVSEAQLASAGDDYPPEIAATYLSTDGLTPDVRELALELAAGARDQTPYHRADAIADFLRTDEAFSYDTNVEPPDPNRDLVDQFLFGPNGRIGYCEYYASSMALMARAIGIPSRVAVGYAPGEAIDDERYLYRMENAHAWAELYFPGYGWQVFEATKTIDPPTRPRGVGSVVPPLPPDINRDFGEFDEGSGDVNTLPSIEPIAGGQRVDASGRVIENPPEARGGNLLVILALVVVAGVVIWSRMRRRQRGLRFLSPADRQWMRLAWAGDRAGVSQRPSETFYEYAGWLEEQLPSRRGEIRMIADGKVWHAYSGRSMTAGMIERIEAAWNRLRMPLVRLAVRRRLRQLLPRRR